MAFKDLALPMVMKGVPVIRLQPKSKLPMDKAWQNKATIDVDTVLLWSSETPSANCGSVAKANGFLFFETDEPGVVERYEKETGEKFPKTFTAQSRKDRFHFYFAQTDESRVCGSITQKEIPFGSLRQNNAYVVSPGSVHPDTGLLYTVVHECPIVPIPDRLVAWLKEKATNTNLKSPAGSQPAKGELIPHGQIHAAMTSEAGRLRKYGYEPQAIESALLDWVNTNCQPPIDEGKVRQVAKSMANYAVDDPRLNEMINAWKKPGNVDEVLSEPAKSEEVKDNLLEYPLWVWEGTLYEEFADLCREGNKIPKEYFIEAVKTVVGAICGHRILPYKWPEQEARFYSILFGPAGVGKSTATVWARELFAGTGLLYDLAQSGAYMNVGCAQGSFGSATGLIKSGFSKHDRILMVYDEATTLIEKFAIPGSGDAFLDAVNQLFESGQMPQLITKESKEAVNRMVHNSILGCTTKEKWNAAFGKTNSESSGFFGRLNIITNDSEARTATLVHPDLSVLRDRFARKIQPLEFQEVIVNKNPEALEMLDAWYEKQREAWKKDNLAEDVVGRLQVMVHRNASHLAWLMNGDDGNADASKANTPIEAFCDEDIMKRAIALAEYELPARIAHQPVFGKNDYAVMEGKIKNVVMKRKSVGRNTLYRETRADTYGVQVFDRAIANLQQEGYIKIGRYEGETRRGRKTQIIMWVEE